MPPAVSPQMVPSLADGVEEEAHLLYPDPIFHLPGSDLALRLWWATPGGSQPCPLSPAPVPLSTSLGLECPPALPCLCRRVGQRAGKSLAKRFILYLRSLGLENSFKLLFLGDSVQF